MNNLLFDFSSGVQGRSPGRGLGDKVPQLKVVTSKIYEFFGSNSHIIYEIETLIIENENYEAQLQSAYSAPSEIFYRRTLADSVIFPSSAMSLFPILHVD